MAGPTTVEATGRDPARAGRFTRLTTAIPGGTVIRDVRAAEDPGQGLVDLSEAFLDGTAGDRTAVERGGRWSTATALPGVTGVRLEVGGEPIDLREGHEGRRSAERRSGTTTTSCRRSSWRLARGTW